MFLIPHPIQITPDLYDKISQGGVVLAVAVLLFAFLTLFVKIVFGPQVVEIANNLKASREGFEMIVAASQAQVSTLELYTNKVRDALDREEQMTALLRTDLLTSKADVTRLQTQLDEQMRLRDLDIARIRQLEKNAGENKEVLETMQRELSRKNMQITTLTDELDTVKRQRQEAADQRDGQVKIIDDLRTQLDALTSVVSTHEAAIKGDGGGGTAIEVMP